MKGGSEREETIWAVVEAYLFEKGEAASLEELVNLFKGVFSEKELEDSLERMEKKWWEGGQGIVLVERKGMWALEVRGRASLFEKLNLEKEEALSPEEWSEGEKTVLAVIAFEGQVKLDRIEQIMGGECGHWALKLQERVGMVKKREGKLQVTPAFWGFFGLGGREDLKNLEREEMVSEESEVEFGDFSLSEEPDYGRIFSFP